MNLPFSDVLDRYTIEVRKAFYGHGNDQQIEELADHMKRELDASLILVPGTTMVNLQKVWAVVRGGVLLGIVNDSIAQMEWQIRAGQNLSLEEVGRRAILTRKLNDIRVKIRQELSTALEEAVETRYYGAGEIEAKDLTLDVQEPLER